MLKRVLLLNFEIEDSDLNIMGRLFSQHFYINQKVLTVIFPQRANSRRGISLDFELNVDTYALFALLTFCYSLKINDSFKGHLYNNTTQIQQLLFNDSELTHLKTVVLANRVISVLDGSGNTPAFSDLTNWSTARIGVGSLGEKILNDLLPYLNNFADPQEIYTLLDYWRRGHDLELIQYGMEAFLNFFKIIESIIGKDPRNHKMHDDWIRNRLATFRLKGFSRKVIFYRNLRNRYNIGHPVLRAPLRRDYDHYLNSFDSDIWNHISDVSEVAKCLMLKSFGFRRYKLVEDGGLWFLDKQTP